MRFLLTTCFLSLISSCVHSQSKLVNALEFDSLRMIQNIQKIDLRSGAEFESIAGIEGFENINCLRKDFVKIAEKSLDKNKTLLVYCLSGHRSADAVKKLNEAGFLKIYELEGGLISYSLAHKR